MDMVDWTDEQITSEAIKFATDNGYPVPELVVLSGRMSKSWGRTYPHRRIIRLNKRFVELNNEVVVRTLIQHEVTHLEHPDHKKGFRNAMRKHGNGKHVYLSGLPISVERYYYKCTECGKVYISARELSIEKYRCTICKSLIVFKERGVSRLREAYRACASPQILPSQLRLLDL